jgi:hypothetical protein
MRYARHTCRHGVGTVIAAVLALSFFAAAPILLTHHHHPNGEEDARCAVCLFVSSQVTPAHAPYDASPDPTAVGLVKAVDEGLVFFLPIRLESGRAPPTA